MQLLVFENKQPAVTSGLLSKKSVAVNQPNGQFLKTHAMFFTW